MGRNKINITAEDMKVRRALQKSASRAKQRLIDPVGSKEKAAAQRSIHRQLNPGLVEAANIKRCQKRAIIRKAKLAEIKKQILRDARRWVRKRAFCD